MNGRPILCVDVDGVINLHEFDGMPAARGVTFELFDGVPHAIFDRVGDRLKQLSSVVDLVWATGWGSRANQYLPGLFGFDPLPEVDFDDLGSRREAFWKVEAIDRFAGDRYLAWIDDSLDAKCRSWADRRSSSGLPTLLVQTDPLTGLQDEHVQAITVWASQL